jgi:hypothetical protein
MTKKFITLNFRCGADYVNADWIYNLVFSYYITKFNLKNCRHVSLSVGAFTALMWKFADLLYDVDFGPLTTEQLALIQDFIEDGAGLIYDESTNVIEQYPEPHIVKKRLNPIPEYPSLAATKTFDDYVNAVCRRLTEAYNPFTGAKETEDPTKHYGIDAVHSYLMRVGDPPVQHRAIIRKSHLVDWVAARLLGVERGEFGGPCPFGPNTLPQDLILGNAPEKIWLDNYVEDFVETPFYWICGLLTFIPIKNLGEHDDGDPKPDSELTNLDEVRYDDNQVSWCFPTMVERAQWLKNYLEDEEPVASKKVGAFITSGSCHYAQADWLIAFEEPGRFVPHYEKCRIPAGTHSKPTTIAEAHLADSQIGSDTGVYGAWKAEFEAWLDYIEDEWFDDPDIILFSDRETKEMVVQQYDPDNLITVDEIRLQKIVEYLINYEENWHWRINEWDLEEPVFVTRPPNHIKITVDEEDEYYSLSEAYWHILSVLNDLANEEEIEYKTLELVLGPNEPEICPDTTIADVDEQDSVYRVFIWWQHNIVPQPDFSYQKTLAQIPALFQASFTELVGPSYPDSSRKKRLRKVKALWTLTDNLDNNVELNAAELLYILAKLLDHHYNPTQETTFQHLPKGYFTFLVNGRFKMIFGENDQLNWLDLGQRWTMKPAVLNEAYR